MPHFADSTPDNVLISKKLFFFVTAKKIKVDNNKTDIIEKHQYFSLDGFEKNGPKKL